MSAVTQTIPTYLGGVSKQIDSKKKPGQVRECLNAYPDPTLGLIKRPGTKFIKTLATTSLTDAKWFYIHRDGDEQYIGRISKGSPGNIKIWNATSGAECTIHDHSFTFTVNTDGGSGATTMRNVATTAGTGQGTNGTGMKVNIIAEGGVITRVYTSEPGTGYVINDTLKITAADAGTDSDVTFTISNIAAHYLQPSGTAADNPSINYDVLTVQDTTIITNKTKPITVEAAQTHVANTKGTVRLKHVRYGSKYNVTINGNTTADLITIMEDPHTATEVLNADDIMAQLETNINALSIAGLTVTPLPSSLELSCTSAFTLDTVDDAGGQNLGSFQEQVNVISDLPNQCAHGRLIKVINTAEAGTAYWAKFIAEAGSGHGPGHWEETVDPNVSTGLLNVSMPHELYNPEPDVFDYQGIDWKDRLVGDDATNSHPSFVDVNNPTTIQQCFLYNTRLGFLTKDNVSLSQAQDWYNFYYTSALTSVASDPIDLSCSSIRPAVLHGVVPTAQGLILFSKNQQFMMFAGSDGPLTPQTAIIRSISNYEMDTNIDPVDVGTNINFVSKTPSYSRIFGMQTRGYEESPIIQDISRAVSQWIPETIDSLFSSPQNSLTGVFGTDSDRLYLYRVYKVGEEQLMQSWFEWKLPGKIQHCTVDNDAMWLVVLNGTDTVLLKASISKSTTEDIVVTNDGLQVNPHMDMFIHANNGLATSDGNYKTVEYDSTTVGQEFSKCYIPYSDISTLNPVILVKGSGVTESGFTINPTVVTDDGAYPYFKVPDLDLSTTPANVYVGYQYNYDVELPKTYYIKRSDEVDYSANLTIARMKFAVGLSSGIGFKLKSKGYRGQLSTFIGTGASNTDTSGTDHIFTVPFPLKEENGVVVKVNGAKQVVDTAYTFTTNSDNQGVVTFNSGYVPTEEIDNNDNTTTPAQTVEITTDTWYDVQPVQDANQYLADDVPLVEESMFTIPIHQRTDNFNLRVFSNSPFPVSLNSMMWEGQYSPRYYQRT